jgi:predicted MFS family arabinose efflux permease
MRRVLHHRDARLLVAGQTLSTIGDRAMLLVFGVWAKTLTGSNAAAGLAFLAFIAPTLLSPLGGLLADRLPRRPLMIVTDLFLAAAVLLLLGVHDEGDVWLLYAVAALYGAGFCVFAAAQSAFLTVMLPRTLLGEANAIFQTLGEFVRLFAPLLGAGLFAVVGGGAVAALDALTFAVSALCLWRLGTREPPPQRPEHHVLRELTAGARHVLAPGTLRRVVLTLAVAMLVIGFSETFVFAVIEHGLHRSPAFFGVVSTIRGLGAIGGGLTAAAVLRRVGDIRLGGLGLALFGAGELALVVPHLAVVAPGLVVAGFGLPWAIVGFATAIQTRTPATLQGRAYAAADAMITTPQTISVALGAALSTVVDYRALIVATTVVMAACGAFLLRRGERGADRLPGPAVRRDVGDAVARDLDDRGARRGERRVERAAEGREVLDPLVIAPIERGRVGEVEAVRGGDVLLEGVGLACDRQEVEDAPAVVVDEDDRQVESQPPRGEQPADVVRERDISDQEHRALLGRGRRGDAERGRHGAVDPVRASVGEHARRVAAQGEERLDVANRHRRGGDEGRRGR